MTTNAKRWVLAVAALAVVATVTTSVVIRS